MNKTFSLLLGLALFALSAFATAANPVQLIKVQSIVQSGAIQAPVFDVLVQNLAMQKEVYIHQQVWDGSWVDFPLSYSRPASNGMEVWSGTYVYPLGFASPMQTWDLNFVVKYVVNGQTYYDNNSGANYVIPRDTGTVLYGGLKVYQDFYAPSYHEVIPGTYPLPVTLANLAFAKTVTVYYTTNNWVTTQTATTPGYIANFWSAFYGSAATNPNSFGYEDWYFNLNTGSATSVTYAISYTVNGLTYWDNNFGRNYTVALK